MNKLVLDIETQNDFADVGGKRNLADLKVSIAGVFDYSTGEYRVYGEKELAELEERILPGGLVIGFNIIDFDLPVLGSYWRRVHLERVPTLDIMRELQLVIGRRVGLDAVATATLGEEHRKSGTGLGAIELWKQGRVEELKKYCLQDVALTKSIYEYGRDRGEVYFEGWKRRYAVPVNWK